MLWSEVNQNVFQETDSLVLVMRFIEYGRHCTPQNIFGNAINPGHRFRCHQALDRFHYLQSVMQRNVEHKVQHNLGHTKRDYAEEESDVDTLVLCVTNKIIAVTDGLESQENRKNNHHVRTCRPSEGVQSQCCVMFPRV